jgi:flagellar FliL protein
MAKAPQGSPTNKGGKKTPLILGATLVVLGAGGFVGYRKMGAERAHAEGAAPAKVEIDPGLIRMEPIVVNLADPSGDRYLRLTVRLMLSQKSVAEAAGQDLATVKLRDAVLSVLSKKRATDLVVVENKEKLRGEIATAIDELLVEPPLSAGDGSTPPCHVMEVYFTEFLLQ